MVALSTIVAVFLNFISLDYKSPRMLGMGGVAVSVSDPQTSFFYNPAGMSGTKSLDVIYLDMRVSYPLITDVGLFITDVLPSLGDNPDKAFKAISEVFGRMYSASIFSFPHFTMTVGNVSFGLGTLFGGGLGFSIALPSNINLKNTFGFTQFELVLGTSVAFMKDTLKFGISASAFKISQVVEVVIRENEFGERITEVMPILGKSTAEVVEDLFSGTCVAPLRCAFGFGGLNIGAMWNPMLKKNITLGLDIRNILAPIAGTTADIGVSYRDKLSFISYVVAIEFHDLIFNEMEDRSFLKRLRFGTEFSTEIPFIKRFASFMFGLGQTYSSVGVELNLKFLSLTLGTYAVELGQEVGSSPLRYYFFKVSM